MFPVRVHRGRAAFLVIAFVVVVGLLIWRGPVGAVSLVISAVWFTTALFGRSIRRWLGLMEWHEHFVTPKAIQRAIRQERIARLVGIALGTGFLLVGLGQLGVVGIGGLLGSICIVVATFVGLIAWAKA